MSNVELTKINPFRPSSPVSLPSKVQNEAYSFQSSSSAAQPQQHLPLTTPERVSLETPSPTFLPSLIGLVRGFSFSSETILSSNKSTLEALTDLLTQEPLKEASLQKEISHLKKRLSFTEQVRSYLSLAFLSAAFLTTPFLLSKESITSKAFGAAGIGTSLLSLLHFASINFNSFSSIGASLPSLTSITPLLLPLLSLAYAQGANPILMGVQLGLFVEGGLDVYSHYQKSKIDELEYLAEEKKRGIEKELSQIQQNTRSILEFFQQIELQVSQILHDYNRLIHQINREYGV